jgi:hypothetical protein
LGALERLRTTLTKAQEEHEALLEERLKVSCQPGLFRVFPPPHSLLSLNEFQYHFPTSAVTAAAADKE